MPIIGPAFDALRMPTMNEAIVCFILLWLVVAMWTNWILYKLCNDQQAELQRLWDKLGIKVPSELTHEDLLDFEENNPSKRRWS